MLALDSVEGPERLWAWFAESPEGTGCGSRNLPIKSWVVAIVLATFYIILEWDYGTSSTR